jgi:hypothetical protein
VAGGRVHVTLDGRYLRAPDPATGATIRSAEGSQLAPVSSTGPRHPDRHPGRPQPGHRRRRLVRCHRPHTTTATTAVVAANGAVYSSRSTGITGHHP